MSNFQKVTTFNNVFGVEKTQSFNDQTFDNKNLVDLRMNLIREEMRELEEAVQQRDRKETIDALSDILYVVYGMGDCLGIDLDKSFDIVHRSNMSKLADNEEQAKASVEIIKQKGVYDSPTYRKITTPDGEEKYLIYNENTKKVLKNKDYIRANFDEML